MASITYRRSIYEEVDTGVTYEVRVRYVYETVETPDPIDEVWCSRCNQPATQTIKGESYCQTHASVEEWKAVAPAWRSRR